MAGHSQFKNIMHRKGAQDAKRAKMFTKVGREIISAVKEGSSPDPQTNPRLRTAIQWAREVNMPRDKIEYAIKRASGDTGGENYEAMRYEGYGPGGVAIIIQVLTDNRNRSASDIRAAFNKYGGNLGETGSVSFMFDNVGRITYPGDVASEEQMFEAALEAGAGNCELEGDEHVITCDLESFGSVRDGMEAKFGEPASAKLIWQPNNTTVVNEDQARSLMKLVDVLEDHDDVQEVFANFEIPDDVMESISAA